MQHHFSIEKYYKGLEDGYVEKSQIHQKVNSPRCCDPLLIPFIYNDRGEKQFISDGDRIAIIDGVKINKSSVVRKFKKYM